MPDKHVHGDKQAIRALKELPKAIQNQALRPALRDSQKEVTLPDAKARVPVAFGTLQDSLVVKAVKFKRQRGGVSQVGSSVTTKEGLFKGESFYGGFVEFGYYHPRNRSVFVEPQPFLRPALYDNAQKLRKVLSGKLRQTIPGTVLKVAKKTGADHFTRNVRRLI